MMQAMPLRPAGSFCARELVGQIALALALVGLHTTSAGAATPTESSVVGGSNAEVGKWPDAAAVFVSGTPICSGVLIAPTVVLTAAHCDSSGLDQVLIGAESLAAGNHGERILVGRRIAYPDWNNTYDILVLVLAAPSTKEPRALASGWTRFEVTDGAKVTIVGFGAIDAEGSKYVDPLQEGITTVTDAACVRARGCHVGARPEGELGAGGMGVDSCSGDSGGPLYVVSSRGTFLAALTSRSYDNATLICSQGGIYTRPDKIVDWIETQAGVAVRRGEEPSVEPLTVTVGQGAEVRISANDPRSKRHRYQIATQPLRGTAAVDDNGRVRMCATGSGPGTDAIVVEVSDASAPSRHLEITVPVTILDGVDDGECVLKFEYDGCGCQSDRAGASWIPLVAALLLRRRRGRCLVRSST
jgi:hypothetical protein